MPKPLIIIIGADKGGVGKTTVARALDDYLQNRRTTRRVFDAEYPSGDLKRFIPSSDIVDLTNIDDQMKVFDVASGVSTIDVRAGLLSNLLRDLNEVKLLDDVRAGNINLALLHVIGPTVSSLREIADTVSTIGGGIRHLLVKNYVNESGFEAWTEDLRFADLLKQAQPNTIAVPHLNGRACTEVQQLGLSFSAFGSDPTHSRMLRGYVNSWLSQVWSEFDRVGLGNMVDGAI